MNRMPALVTRVLFVYASAQIDLDLGYGKIFVPPRREPSVGQIGSAYHFITEIRARRAHRANCLACDTPSDEVKEAKSFQSHFEPPLPHDRFHGVGRVVERGCCIRSYVVE